MAAPNVRGAYELLRRAMGQQGPQQQGTDFGLTPDAAPEDNLDSYGDPQGGLLSRLLALQAEQRQYQPSVGNNGQTSPVWRTSAYEETPQTRITVRPRSAISLSNLPDGESKPAYSPVGADLAAPRQRSFSDRLQASWDRPHPYGVMTILKEALNGMEQAVQGSIDATSVPSTEEEAFRQNQGRELGPIGAWKAASLLAPKAPGGIGGIFAKPPIGALPNHPRLPAGVRITRQGIDGPVANTNVPAVRLVSRNRNPSPEHDPPDPANGMATPASVGTQNPTQAAPQASGGLPGVHGDKPTPPQTAATPTIKIDAGGLNGGIGVPPTVSLDGGGADDGKDCKEERQRALEICSDAAGNGWTGDHKRWKSDYGVGPYRKSSAEPWNIWDCMRGFMREPCLGNSTVDQRKTRPKVKRYSLRSRKKLKWI
jgi:hypothetical protein